MKTIYIISPSSNIVDEININSEIKKQIEKAEKKFSEININIVYGDLFLKSYLWYGGTVIDRIKELNEGFLNKNIDYIMTTQGGYNSNELLKYLDFDLIKNNYKPIIGLSDITILLNAIYKKTGKITYHGYDYIWQVGKSAITSFSLNQLNNFLNKQKLEEKIEGILLNNNKNASGILIGGCIPSYSLILGTEYDPIELNKNFIFFIEDIGEPGERIFSYIGQLLNNKLFLKNCKGFIIGNFLFCDFESKKKYDIDELIKEKLDFLNIPVLKINKIGHIIENYILPIGKEVEILDNNLLLK